MSEVAFASGFASIRQFNDVMRQQFGVAPSALRGRPADDGRRAAPGRLALRLACREPYAADPMLDWLAARAVPGVEEVGLASDGARRAYRRVLRLPGSLASVELAPVSGGWAARLALAELAGVRPAVGALRRMLDLDADPAQVDDALAADRVLRPLVQRRPGLRVPGAADGFETAVKAVLGQQVSVAAARTLAGRLASACGDRMPGAADDGGAAGRAFPAAAAVTGCRLLDRADRVSGPHPARARRRGGVRPARPVARGADRRRRGGCCSRCRASARGRPSTSPCARWGIRTPGRAPIWCWPARWAPAAATPLGGGRFAATPPSTSGPRPPRRAAPAVRPAAPARPEPPPPARRGAPR